MTLAILLLALVVATCFIAYFADNLGKHLGKKRVSLQIGRFNLRPRQTATLISMASSVVIMLFTVGFLLATSGSIRNALLRYDAEKREANIQRRENQRLVRDLNGQRTLLEEQSEALNAQIKANRKLTQAVLAQRQKAEAQLRAASARLGGVRNLLRAAERAKNAAANGAAAAKAGERAATSRASQAQARYATAQNRFQNVQSQLGNARRQFTLAQKRLQQEKTRVDAANLRLTKVRSSLSTTRDQLGAAQANLHSAQRQQREASAQLGEAQSRLKETQLNFEKVQSEVRATLAQFSSAIEDIEELKARRTQLQNELDLRSEQLREFTLIAAQIASRDVAIRLGDVFADVTIPAGMSSRTALEKLRQMMAQGRKNLQAPRNTLTLVVPPAASSGGESTVLTEDEFLASLAADLSELNVEASIRLVAARDHARKETEIFARLMPIAVSTIFPKDAVLAAGEIDGAVGDARIFNQLLALLGESEKRARDLGVVPLLTSANQYFYANGTNERIFEALRSIRDAGGVARVRVLAAEDVTTVDPLRVRFEIERE